MPYTTISDLKIFQFESLIEAPLVQGIFTRQGGVSEGPWNSLNVSSGVGDQPQRVAENRRRVLASLKRPIDSTYDVWLVHSDTVLHADEPRTGPPFPQADGLITVNPGVTLMLPFADCVPVFLFDPRTPAVGLIHAGWKGTVLGAVQAGVAAMQDEFGTSPEDLRAGIGPAIAAHHYPVGPEVDADFRRSFGAGADRFLRAENGAIHLDLPGANEALLRRAGVEQIEVAASCTACEPELWFSHRGENGRTGRFAAVLALPRVER